jgi:hypothetical protein
MGSGCIDLSGHERIARVGARLRDDVGDDHLAAQLVGFADDRDPQAMRMIP